MKFYIYAYSDDLYEELRNGIIETGNEVIRADLLYSSIELIEAAILVKPLSNSQSEYTLPFREFVERMKYISSFLPENRICIISNEKYYDFGSKIHRIVGNWPSVWPKIKRWIDSIRTNKKSVKFAMNPIQLSIEKAIYLVLNNQKLFDNVRVFAFTTPLKIRYLSSMKGINIKKATVLLREFTVIDEFLNLSEEKSFNESIDFWDKMKESGLIDNLEIYRFDFHPTYCIYIFDDRYAILENFYYDLKKKEYSFDKDVLLVDSSTDLGKLFIKKSINSFDKLVENYRGL